MAKNLAVCSVIILETFITKWFNEISKGRIFEALTFKIITNSIWIACWNWITKVFQTIISLLVSSANVTCWSTPITFYFIFITFAIICCDTNTFSRTNKWWCSCNSKTLRNFTFFSIISFMTWTCVILLTDSISRAYFRIRCILSIANGNFAIYTCKSRVTWTFLRTSTKSISTTNIWIIGT